MTATTAQFSPRAKRAIKALGTGCTFRYALEKDSFTGAQKWRATLRGVNGGPVKGFGFNTYIELKDAGLLIELPRSTSGATYYGLEEGA